MPDWNYKERAIFKLYSASIFLLGELFFLFVFFLIFTAENEQQTGITGLFLLFLFFVFWNVFWIYMLYNAAIFLKITANSITVEWSKNRQSSYNINDVKIKTIGSTSIQVIQLKDQNWTLCGFVIPRIIVLDGTSKKYKELILELIKRNPDLEISKT